MAKNDIEKMLEHLIMNESEKANDLFHDIIVNKSRSINESFTNDDVEQSRDIKDDIDEIENEMYYSDIELSEGEEEGEEPAEEEADVNTKEEELEKRLSAHVDNDNDFKKKVFDLKSDMADLKAMFDKIIGSEEGLGDLDGEFETSDDVSAEDVPVKEGKTFRQDDEEETDVRAKRREAWNKRKERKAEPEEDLVESYDPMDPDGFAAAIEGAQDWCSEKFKLDEYLKNYGSDIQWNERDSLDKEDKVYSSAELIDSIAHYCYMSYEREVDDRVKASLLDAIKNNLEGVATEIVRSELQPAMIDAGYTITDPLEESRDYDAVKAELDAEEEEFEKAKGYDDFPTSRHNANDKIKKLKKELETLKAKKKGLNEENQTDFDYEEVSVDMDPTAQTGAGDDYVEVDNTSIALSTDIEDRQAGGPVEYAKSEPDAYGYHSIDFDIESDLVNNDDSSTDFYGAYFNKAVAASKQDQLADVDTSAQLLPIPEKK